jgi:hypothetical protein
MQQLRAMLEEIPVAKADRVSVRARALKPVVELDPELRLMLDEIPVAKLAEYLCARVQLDQGQTMLQLEFVEGRYERMRRFTLALASR